MEVVKVRSKIKIREDLCFLQGLIESIRFPLVNTDGGHNAGYYDLIDLIAERFDQLKKEINEVMDEK